MRLPVQVLIPTHGCMVCRGVSSWPLARGLSICRRPWCVVQRSAHHVHRRVCIVQGRRVVHLRSNRSPSCRCYDRRNTGTRHHANRVQRLAAGRCSSHRNTIRVREHVQASMVSAIAPNRTRGHPSCRNRCGRHPGAVGQHGSATKACHAAAAAPSTIKPVRERKHATQVARLLATHLLLLLKVTVL